MRKLAAIVLLAAGFWCLRMAARYGAVLKVVEQEHREAVATGPLRPEWMAEIPAEWREWLGQKVKGQDLN